MKPVRRTYAEVQSELHMIVRNWKRTHCLTDTQVVTLMAQAASGYAEAAYVAQSRIDKVTDRHAIQDVGALIAAAPDMLSVLKRMVNAWEPEPPGTDYDTWIEAKAVLTKARGD